MCKQSYACACVNGTAACGYAQLRLVLTARTLKSKGTFYIFEVRMKIPVGVILCKNMIKK